MRLTLTPTTAGLPAPVTENSGPWALLRLLDAGHVTATGQADKVRITFGSPGSSAEFELTAHSVHNPFTLAALRAFRCPTKL